MPTIEENRSVWNARHHWRYGGDEWSITWGGADMQWYMTVLPRVHAFLPTGTILEIAPGFGRWSQFLLPLCNRLILVDLSEKCIQACKERFGMSSQISYFVNDGKSLAMIPDESIDLVFSFDALVHVEADVIASYLQQVAVKLNKNGVGFIHHSNIGAFSRHFAIRDRLPGVLRAALIKLGIFEERDHWRAFSMTAEKFAECAQSVGLQCISQELINWGTKPWCLIDCISVVTRHDSELARPNRILRNGDFNWESSNARSVAPLYAYNAFRKPGEIRLHGAHPDGSDQKCGPKEVV